jgi:hypothetical protein
MDRKSNEYLIESLGCKHGIVPIQKGSECALSYEYDGNSRKNKIAIDR